MSRRATKVKGGSTSIQHGGGGGGAGSGGGALGGVGNADAPGGGGLEAEDGVTEKREVAVPPLGARCAIALGCLTGALIGKCWLGSNANADNLHWHASQAARTCTSLLPTRIRASARTRAPTHTRSLPT